MANTTKKIKDPTEAALSAIQDALSARDAAAAEPQAPPAPPVTAAEEPLPGDQTVAADGALIYLDQPASQQLDDQILDASVDEAGRVQFALAPQA